MSVKFLAQGNNDLPLTGFEPKQLAIIRLPVRRVNHSSMTPLYNTGKSKAGTAKRTRALACPTLDYMCIFKRKSNKKTVEEYIEFYTYQ
jgi:hypothetical protein